MFLWPLICKTQLEFAKKYSSEIMVDKYFLHIFHITFKYVRNIMQKFIQSVQKPTTIYQFISKTLDICFMLLDIFVEKNMSVPNDNWKHKYYVWVEELNLTWKTIVFRSGILTNSLSSRVLMLSALSNLSKHP